MIDSQPYPKIFDKGGEVHDIGKHSSLLQNGKNYCRKKFYSRGTCGLCYKTF